MFLYRNVGRRGVIRDVGLGVGVGDSTDLGGGGGETDLGIRTQVHLSVGTAPELCKTARMECYTIFLERTREAIVSQTNIGTVLKATLEKLLRDRVERIWAFPSA